MTWSEHILYFTNKAKKRIHLLSAFKYSMSRYALFRCYLSFVRPLLEYADIIFDNCFKQEKSMIENLQYAALRLVTGVKKGTSRKLLLKDCGLCTKFKQSTIKSDVIVNAELDVQTKLDNLHNAHFNDKVRFKSMVIKYIKKLNLGSSPGSDGLLAEHLKYAINSKIVDYLRLSVMFTICIKYGIVSPSFSHGLLVPILNNTTLGPTNARNYRAITISSTLSKILQLYIYLMQLGIMSLAKYSLCLSLVEALIWLHILLMMCFLIVRNVDHLFIHVRWTPRVLLT